MEEDPVGFEIAWDDKRFMKILWPELVNFVPSFDTLKLLQGWAGLYAVNNLDGNAILGEWPKLKGLYLANSLRPQASAIYCCRSLHDGNHNRSSAITGSVNFQSGTYPRK